MNKKALKPIEIKQTEVGAAQSANNALFWLVTHARNKAMVDSCKSTLAEIQKYYGELFSKHRDR